VQYYNVNDVFYLWELFGAAIVKLRRRMGLIKVKKNTGKKLPVKNVPKTWDDQTPEKPDPKAYI